jgi:hypothetical protein
MRYDNSSRKGKYVVLPMEVYNKLRELELEAAIQEAPKEV